MRLVDGDVGQVVEDAGAPVGRSADGEQRWALVDERGGDPAGGEVRVIEYGPQEADVGGNAANPKLGQAAPGAAHRGLEIGSTAGHFDHHGVEVGADLSTQVRTAVKPDSGAAGVAVGGDPSGVGAESVGRVLGGDPALQRRPPGLDGLLAQAEFGQRRPTGDAQLRGDKVDVGDLLGDGVLDLDARVHLDEHVPPAIVEQELHRAGAAVADLPGEGHGVGTDPIPQRGRQIRGGRQFDDLLMAALDTAVALEQVNDVAVGVGEDLHLDVARVDDGLLEEHPGVAERRRRFAAGRFGGLPQYLRFGDPAHPAATAAGDGLDEQRVGHGLRRGDEVVDVGGRSRGCQHRKSGRPGGVDRPGLVAGQLQDLRRRADEDDAGVGAGRGEFGVFREEPVAGIDRVGAAAHGGADDLLHRQVGPHRVARLADLVGLVSLGAVQRVSVLVGVDRGGGDAQFVGRPERPDRNLATIGNEQLGDHRFPLSLRRATSRASPGDAGRGCRRR